MSRTGRGDRAVFADVVRVSALRAALGPFEWIILTVPLTHDTRYLFNRDVLSRCNGAALINAGRGAVVEERALSEALNSGWIRAAALDVFELEPLPPDSPLWDDARVIVSPHMSGLTTTEGAATGFLECLSTFERGETPPWLVDRERGY